MPSTLLNTKSRALPWGVSMVLAGSLLVPLVSGGTPSSTTLYTEESGAVLPLATYTQAGTGNFANQSVTFSLNDSYDPGEVLSLTSSNPPSIATGVISFFQGTVYRGDGTQAVSIGSIDSTSNGVARELKINFVAGFTNGNFANGLAGWTVTNQRATLGYADFAGADVTTGVSTIGGFAAPVDYLWGPGNAPNQVAQSTINRDRASLSRGSFNTNANNGKLNMALTNAQCSIGFCVIRGPHVISDSSVFLAANDEVRFKWEAAAGGDAFDVYGYLLNTANGKAVRLLDETGRAGQSASGTVNVKLGTSRVEDGDPNTAADNYFTSGSRRDDLIRYNSDNTRTAGTSAYDDTKFTDGSNFTSGNYRFVFLAGSYDDTGGLALGATFAIDDINVVSSAPPAVSEADVQAVARLLSYSNTNALTRDRTVSFSSSLANFTTPVDAATISVTASNDAPVVAAITAGSYTDTAAYDTFTPISRTISATDEEGSTLTYGLTGATVVGTTATLVGPLGTSVLNTSTGAFTFTPNVDAINELSAGTVLTFEFTTSDGSRTSARSFTINITATAEARPSAPEITSINPGSSLLTVEFEAPTYAGTSPISNYEYSTDGGVTWLALNPAVLESPITFNTTSDGLGPLENGTEYSVAIRAVNASGPSVRSNILAATPSAAVQFTYFPTKTLAPIPSATQASPGTTNVILDGAFMAHDRTPNVESGSLVFSGNGWSVGMDSKTGSGTPIRSHSNGDIRVESGGNISFQLSGYRPRGQVAVYLMPQKTLIANMTVNRKGQLSYSGLRVPKGVSLTNKFIQVNGFTPSGDVKSVTTRVSLFQRERVAESITGTLDATAKSSIRGILRAVRGESVVRCVAFADLTNADEVAEKTAKATEYCDFAVKRVPSLTPRVVVREPIMKKFADRVVLRLRG